MLVIRLQRVGRKNDPSFRLVVTDSRRASRSGAYLEAVGVYNPIKKKIDVKKERVDYWISKGSKVSDSVRSLLKKQGY